MHGNTATAALALASLLYLPSPGDSASSPLSIEAVSVSPASPGPSVLCGLSVRLKNAGVKTATDFRFRVRIEGQDVTSYNLEIWAVNVAAGTSATILLHNFYAASTAKASFPIEVTVLEGSWAEVKHEGSTSTTTPLGPIEGLPVSITQTMRISAR